MKMKNHLYEFYYEFKFFLNEKILYAKKFKSWGRKKFVEQFYVSAPKNLDKVTEPLYMQFINDLKIALSPKPVYNTQELLSILSGVIKSHFYIIL